MRLLRSFPLMAFALVLLSIVGVTIAQRSVELMLVAGALAAMSWYVTEGPRGRHLPRWVSTLLVIGVSLNVLVEMALDHQAWIEALGRFGVWLTIIKLYERKTPRDYGQLLALSVFLMLDGAVVSSELLFGAVLLVYAALGLYVLLLFRLHVSHERARLARLEAGPRGYRLVPPVKTVVGPHLRGHFRALAALVGIVGFGLSLLVFLIFPRGLGHGAVPALLAAAEARRPAFTDTIELGGGTRITDSRRPVMTLQVRDETGEPIALDGPLWLRGAVLSTYRDRRWTKARANPRQIETRPGAFSPLAAVEPEPARSWTILVEPYQRQNVMFAPLVPVALRVDEPGEARFDPRTQILWRAGRATRDGYAVRVQPQPTTDTWIAVRGGSGPPRGVVMRSSTRVTALAGRLLEEAGLPTEAPRDPRARAIWWLEAASALGAWLGSDRFTYVTDLSDVVEADPAGLDPIERFLFETRRGHCEYYASALAALCHAVDVPARIVTGYIAYEYDERERRYMVLESNAHAWVEVFAGPRGWVTLDPTPAETLDRLHEGGATLADRLSWVYERFEGTWNAQVATFDAEAQGRLATRLDLGWTDRLGRFFGDVREWLADVNRAFYFGPAGYVWMGVVAFALVLAIMVLVRLMRRSRAIHRALRLHHLRGAEYQRMLRQLGFYLDMLRVLEQARLAKPRWCPPRLHARALAGEHPEAARLVRRITDLFYLGRYGRRSMSGPQVAEARRLVGELAAVTGRRRAKAPRA